MGDGVGSTEVMMARRYHELSETDEAMALCLPREKTRRKLAKTGNVGVRTVSNELAAPALRARVGESRGDSASEPGGCVRRAETRSSGVPPHGRNVLRL